MNKSYSAFFAIILKKFFHTETERGRPPKAPGPTSAGAGGGPRGLMGAANAEGHFNKFFLFHKFDRKTDNIKIFIFIFLISSDNKLATLKFLFIFELKKIN